MRGVNVDVAYDGNTALTMARSGGYAIIVLDVMLPGKNGYEVSRQLKDEMERGEVPPLKILLITARKLDNAVREEFVSTWSKADACLYKPFDLDGLMEHLTALLGTPTA
jgi:DNA-binding response OmpR family regulator